MVMTLKSNCIVQLTALDAVLLTLACLIPAASHVLAVPLYMLNPMLALLLVGVLLGKDWRNALVLAVLLPLVSCLLTGMPAAPKMVCMMAELATVAGLFHLLSHRWAVMPAVLVAVVAGKVRRRHSRRLHSCCRGHDPLLAETVPRMGRRPDCRVRPAGKR